MFKCHECGGKDFGNNAGPYGLVRICKKCEFRFHAARDAEYLDTGEEEAPEEVTEEVVEEAPKEVKPRRTRRTTKKA